MPSPRHQEPDNLHKRKRSSGLERSDSTVLI
jgi:hypothetical protein